MFKKRHHRDKVQRLAGLTMSYHLLPSTARMHVIACSLCNLHDNLLGSAHCFHPCQCKTKHGKTDQNNITQKGTFNNNHKFETRSPSPMQPRHQATWLSPTLVPTTWKDKAQRQTRRYNPIFLWKSVNSMAFLIFWDIYVLNTFYWLYFPIIANHQHPWIPPAASLDFPIGCPWWGCPPWSLLSPNLLAASAFL